MVRVSVLAVGIGVVKEWCPTGFAQSADEPG
jgi:hypothetical protein